ncbi:MAG: ABC transporter substrate-binding protein, partial [Myxococcales bacterium]|nr:ABC transporter substrate-binding protein [Myxococcales bacterium]
ALLMMASFATSGCSALLSFRECNVDGDCKGTTDGGGQLYCSDDHMCVGAIPDYLLCKVSQPPDGKIPDGALVIGGLYRTSGANDVNDHTFRQAADLAAQEFIAKSYNVAHVVCDTAGDSAQAARAYNVVIDRFGAKVIVGPDTSDEVFAVAKEVKSRRVPIISPSATNPDISSLDDDHLVWRTAASDNLQSKVLATLPPSVAKVDIIYVADSSYASGLQSAFVSNFPKPISLSLGFDAGDSAAMNSAVSMVSADAPDYALLIADFDAPPLMAAVSKATGLAMTQLLMTDSAKKPSLWGQLAGNYAVMTRVRGTGPANPPFSDPSGKAFIVMQTNYKSEFGEDPAETAFVGNAYDAFYVAAFATLSLPADKRVGANIVANLARLSDHGSGVSVTIGPNNINTGVTPLQMGATVDLVGTSGPLDFDDNGDVVSAPIEKWSVDTTGAMPMFKTDTIVVPPP